MGSKSSILLILFYSTIFSRFNFYAVFILPLSLIFYLKLTLLKEFFVMVLAATLSYLSFRLRKPGFLEVNSHVAPATFFGLSFSLIQKKKNPLGLTPPKKILEKKKKKKKKS